MSGSNQGSGADNSKAASAPATPTAAPTTKPVMPPAPAMPAAPKPATPASGSPKLADPLTFSHMHAPKPQTAAPPDGKDQTPESPAADAPEQPQPSPKVESAQEEEPKPESTEKDKEGDDFIKKFVEYLMKLIQSQLEEEDQKKQQGGGASFGSSLAGIDPQKENDKNTKRFDSPRPKPSGKSMEKELNELSEQYDKLGNSDDLGKFKDVLKMRSPLYLRYM